VGPGDDELFEELLGHLATGGAIDERTEPGVVIIEEYGDQRLDEPLRLHLTPATLGERLRAMIPNARGLSLNSDTLHTAWGLFLVHLDEAVATARPGETELVLGRGGVDSVRPDGTRTPFAPEVEEYIALNEHHERLIQYYADRGEMDIDIRNEILIVHDLDGHRFGAPLRIRVTSEEIRRQMRAADDREAAWRAIIEQIDVLARSIDPRAAGIVLTPAGVVVRPS
jgi:hypothetical protein